MVTDLNNTGKRKRIFTKHKNTTSENDNILLPDKETQTKMRRYSDSDSPYLPPKFTSKNSTLQSPKRTHLSNINGISSPQISQDYDPIVQNLIALPESPAKTLSNLTPLKQKSNNQIKQIKHKLQKITNK